MNAPRTEQDNLWNEYRRAGAALNAFPKGHLGLTPDSVKATPEWKAAKQDYERAFSALRAFNAHQYKAVK